VPQPQSADGSAVIIENFSKRLRLARASELALSRRFLEAESLLCGRGMVSSDPDDLDLLARIYLKQGRFADARGAWDRASVTDQSNAKYASLLEELAKHEIKYVGRKRVILVSSAIMFAMAIVTILLIKMKGF
jgi:hypothetical protein